MLDPAVSVDPGIGSARGRNELTSGDAPAGTIATDSPSPPSLASVVGDTVRADPPDTLPLRPADRFAERGARRGRSPSPESPGVVEERALVVSSANVPA